MLHIKAAAVKRNDAVLSESEEEPPKRHKPFYAGLPKFNKKKRR